MSVFKEELKALINKHNVEYGSGTPDFLLAQYLMACLSAFNQATRLREGWWAGKTGTTTPTTTMQPPEPEEREE